jgi:hypothetical protein
MVKTEFNRISVESKRKLSFWRKLYLNWKFEWRYWRKDFYQGVKNLIKWFPVIWKDRSWDDHYIWEVLKIKLKFQADYIGKRGIHLDAKRDAQRMMTCVGLIEKVQEESYQTEYSDYHYSEFHFVAISQEDIDDIDDEDLKVDMKGASTLHIQEIWEKYDDYFAKYPHAYREVTKTDKYIFENDSKQHIAMNMGYYLDKKANRILFAMLETYLRSWWD